MKEVSLRKDFPKDRAPRKVSKVFSETLNMLERRGNVDSISQPSISMKVRLVFESTSKYQHVQKTSFDNVTDYNHAS